MNVRKLVIAIALFAFAGCADVEPTAEDRALEQEAASHLPELIEQYGGTLDPETGAPIGTTERRWQCEDGICCADTPQGPPTCCWWNGSEWDC